MADKFISELKNKLRDATDEDRLNLATRSYSQLDLMHKCNMRFKLKYIDKNYSDTTSLALQIGSILHKGLELKGRYIIEGETVDYDFIKDQVLNGCEEVTAKGSERIVGISELRKKYWDEWGTSDNASGKNYNDKMETYFEQVLPSRMEGLEWDVLGTEIPFEFVYDERVIIKGFIDRIDMSNKDTDDSLDDLKVVDYKSSKKVYSDTDIKTPMQMITYALACLNKYGRVPVAYEYDFILLDEKQTSPDVCTTGYLKRGVKKLDAMLDEIDEMTKSNIYTPSPTPLCHWCDFCSTNSNADPRTKHLCVYYSKWTPENKTFEKNQIFDPAVQNKPRRKLIF